MKHRISVPAASAVLCGLAALGLAAPALAGPVSGAAGELVRYDATGALVGAPEGASARVHAVETGDGRTVVSLHVSGMAPDAAYGAHAHVAACGLGSHEGAVAGPHWQRVKDPVTPSVDPAYANPRNEIWLDLTTNAAGNGRAKAVLDWTFDDQQRPGSVIIHEKHTATGPGAAGTAGKRVACLTVPF